MKTTIALAASILCICGFLIPGGAGAAIVLPAEFFSVFTTAQACDRFTAAHPGRTPSSWSDLEPFFPQPVDQRFPSVLPTRRYAFLAQPLAMPPLHGGELFIISRQPFRAEIGYRNWLDNFTLNLEPLGRYLIYRSSKDTRFRHTYVDEATIQKLFADHPSLLPAADTEPQRPYTRNAYTRVIFFWAAVLFVIGFVIYHRVSRHRRIPTQHTIGSIP